jgi:Undecaprenyl-phosphate glucose phosphotransferase
MNVVQRPASSSGVLRVARPSVYPWQRPASQLSRRRYPIKFSSLVLLSTAAEFFDVVLVALASSIVYARLIEGRLQPDWPYLAAPFAIAAIYTCVSLGLRQYRAIKTRPLHTFTWSGICAVTLSFSFYLSGLFLFKLIGEYSRLTLLLQFVGVALSIVGLRGTIYSTVRTAIAKGLVRPRRAVLIGEKSACSRLSVTLRESNIRPVATLLVCSGSEDCSDPSSDEIASMVTVCRDLLPDDVILASANPNLRSIQPLAQALCELPVNVHLSPAEPAELLKRAHIGEIGRVKTIVTSSKPLSASDQALKRAFDLAVASSALIILAPVMFLIAAAVKATSGGPVLYRQIRHGFNNERILVWKFRTMHISDEGEKFTQAVPGDKRITPLGRVLRETNLDELPQLFNVLAGNMSIVGPRPHAVAHNQVFETLIGSFARRHNVRPGLTGWAQVNGCRGPTDTVEKMQRRIDYDLQYLDSWSLLLDLKIIVLTLFSKKSYENAC